MIHTEALHKHPLNVSSELSKMITKARELVTLGSPHYSGVSASQLRINWRGFVYITFKNTNKGTLNKENAVVDISQM